MPKQYSTKRKLRALGGVCIRGAKRTYHSVRKTVSIMGIMSLHPIYWGSLVTGLCVTVISGDVDISTVILVALAPTILTALWYGSQYIVTELVSMYREELEYNVPEQDMRDAE